MTWFYNSYSGELTSASGPLALAYQVAIHTGTGWHQLRIPATDTAAQAAAAASSEVPGGAPPTTSLTKGLGTAATSGITGLASSAAGSVVSDTLKPLFQGNLWLRILEVALGVVLVAVGLAKITHAVPVATKIAEAIP